MTSREFDYFWVNLTPILYFDEQKAIDKLDHLIPVTKVWSFQTPELNSKVQVRNPPQ